MSLKIQLPFFIGSQPGGGGGGGPASDIAGASGLAADPQYSANRAYVDPTRPAEGNNYHDFPTAYAAMAATGRRGVIVPVSEIVESGAHDGPPLSPTVVDSSKTWAVDEWADHIVWNLDQEGWGVIESNTVDTLTLVNGQIYDFATQNSWTPGDRFQITPAMIIDIPADFALMELRGDLPAQNFVLFKDGAAVSGLHRWDLCRLVNLMTSGSPISEGFEKGQDGINIFTAGGDAGSVTGGPVWEIPAGKQYNAFAERAGGLKRFGPIPAINVGANAVLGTFVGPMGAIDGLAVSGDASAVWLQIRAATGAFINPTQAFSGSIVSLLQTDARNLAFDSTGTTYTAGDVGAALGQSLTRNAADWVTIPVKNPPVGADQVIIEDSENGDAKARVQLNVIPPGNHAIGGSEHSAGTHSTLNSKLTDAKTIGVKTSTWNAAANSPTLTSGLGVEYAAFRVATAGSTVLDGIREWAVGDLAVFLGGAWRRWAAAPDVPKSHYQTGAGPTAVDDNLTIVESYTIPAGLPSAAYDVSFEASISGNSNSTATYGVYLNGVLVDNDRDRSITNSTKGSISINGRVTATAADVISIRAICSNALGFDVDSRSLTVAPVTAL